MSKRRPIVKAISLLAAATMMATVTAGAVSAAPGDSSPVRQMEFLDRGLVTMQKADGIYMSWRFLGTDPDDVSFNIYRDGEKIATVSDCTNYTDPDGDEYSEYAVSAIIDGVEGPAEGATLPMLAQNGSANGNYIELKLENPGPRASIQFRNARADLYAATGKYYYMPVDLNRLNQMQTVVKNYNEGRITKEAYDAAVAEFRDYTNKLGLDETGGDGPTLRELGYTEEGVTPLRTDAEGKLMYRTATYTSNDMSTADLDGDGQYELIVKWDPSDSRDSMISYETSAPCVIDAYDIVDGQAVLMWRIDMGYNIRAGAHDTQMQVYDFDGDGKGEIILRTADGTTSGTVTDGVYTPAYVVGNQDAANIEQYLIQGNAEKVNALTTNILKNYSIVWEDPVYNNNAGEAGQDGYITTGAYSGNFMDQTWCKVFCYGPATGPGDEYVTAFDGETGKILDSIPYQFAITEDMWGITPYCRRSAGCSGKIQESDKAHIAADPTYVPQYFWVENDNANDIGNNYMMFNDSTGNRAGRFLGAVATLDGETPSALIVRGYYARTTIAAYTIKDDKLVPTATFDSSEYENHLDYECRGNHNMGAADVDNDGMDEVIYGSMAWDLDGNKLVPKYVVGVSMPDTQKAPASGTVMDPKAGYNEDGSIKEGYRFSYNYHGDAIHILPMDKTNRMVVMTPHEDSGDAVRGWAASMDVHDATTGEVLAMSWRSGDQGRGAAGNVDPWNPDTIVATGNISINLKTGQKSSVSAGSNGLIYWTGSLVTQILNSTIDQVGANNKTERVMSFNGASFNNGSKTNPSLQADLFGDWREELVLRSGADTIRIYTTNMPTQYKIRTLMHDPAYRNGVATQNTAYNQCPHPGFFLGYEGDVTEVNKVNGSIIPNSDPIIATGKRDDISIVTPENKLPTTAAASALAYKPNEKITITVNAPAGMEKVWLVNEWGSGLAANTTVAKEADRDIWTFEFTLGTKGDRTLTVMADGLRQCEVSFTVTNESVAPPAQEAPQAISAKGKAVVKVNEPFEVTIKTNQAVSFVRLFNESGMGLAPISLTYEDNADGTRTWTYTTNVGSIGTRTLNVRVAGADRVYEATDVNYTVRITR